jgi:SAM-dependent methyltransferase
MGIMFFPDADKALQHLHRVTKPGGKCYITSWYRMQHRELAVKIVRQLRGSDATFNLSSPFWKEEMEDPAYLPTALGKAGFKDTAGETKLEYIVYKGEEGIAFGIENLPKLYAKMMQFGEGEEEMWNQLWGDELREECVSGDGMRLKMWANIGWGTK